MRHRVWTAFLLLSFVGCRAPVAEKAAAEPQPRNEEHRSADTTWGRRRDCAELAARFMSRRNEGAVTWSNHYNSEHDRCYVTIQRPPQTDSKGVVKYLAVELYDTLENDEIAQCTLIGRPFCGAKDATGVMKMDMDCDACRALVESRMSK